MQAQSFCFEVNAKETPHVLQTTRPPHSSIVLCFWVVWREGKECCSINMWKRTNVRRSDVTCRKEVACNTSSLQFFFSFFFFLKESKSKFVSRRCRLQRWSQSVSAPHLSTQPTLFASAFPTTPYSNVPFGIASSTCWRWGPTRSWNCSPVYSAMGSTRRTETLWGAPCSRYGKHMHMIDPKRYTTSQKFGLTLI